MHIFERAKWAPNRNEMVRPLDRDAVLKPKHKPPIAYKCILYTPRVFRFIKHRI